MKKPTLCLIFGGKSSEYEVSLASVASILNAIDGKKYKRGHLVFYFVNDRGLKLVVEGQADTHVLD